MTQVGLQFAKIQSTVRRGIRTGNYPSRAVSVINIVKRPVRQGPAVSIQGTGTLAVGPSFFDHIGSKSPQQLHLDDMQEYNAAKRRFIRSKRNGELPPNAAFIDFPPPKSPGK